MNREELLSRIAINPNVCFGKPCIRGHRLWVSLILDFLASGMTIEEILQEYRRLGRGGYFCLYRLWGRAIVGCVLRTKKYA